MRQLAIEAQYFGLNELATACDAAVAGVVSLPTLAAACDGGFSAADVAGLSDGEVTELLQQQGVNVLLGVFGHESHLALGAPILTPPGKDLLTGLTYTAAARVSEARIVCETH